MPIFDVLTERSRNLQTIGRITGTLTASDRVLVVDSPIVDLDRMWLAPIITAQVRATAGAGLKLALWLGLCDSKIVPHLDTFTPPAAIVGDTTATFDITNRYFPLRTEFDNTQVSPDGTHQIGIIAAGNGLADPIEIPEGWFIRAIVNGLGTADGANWTRPFPPSDTVLQLSYQYVLDWMRNTQAISRLPTVCE